jgi:hypothetical protein
MSHEQFSSGWQAEGQFGSGMAHLQLKNTLVSSVVFTSSPLVSSVVATSSPLVSSVVFTSFSLVSSVVFHTYFHHTDKLNLQDKVTGHKSRAILYTNKLYRRKYTQNLKKLHSNRVEKMWKTHSKRVEKMWKTHSKRVYYRSMTTRGKHSRSKQRVYTLYHNIRRWYHTFRACWQFIY